MLNACRLIYCRAITVTTSERRSATGTEAAAFASSKRRESPGCRENGRSELKGARFSPGGDGRTQPLFAHQFSDRRHSYLRRELTAACPGRISARRPGEVIASPLRRSRLNPDDRADRKRVVLLQLVRRRTIPRVSIIRRRWRSDETARRRKGREGEEKAPPRKRTGDPSDALAPLFSWKQLLARSTR